MGACMVNHPTFWWYLGPFRFRRCRPDNCMGSAGFVASNMHVRIVPIEGTEGGDPRAGEIQLYGPLITAGYYRRPEETAALFTEDRWLKTGDIGRLVEDSEFPASRRRRVLPRSQRYALIVLGRLKGLVKNLGGKFVDSTAALRAFRLTDTSTDLISPLLGHVVILAKGRKFTTALFFLNARACGDFLSAAGQSQCPAGVDPQEFYAAHPTIQAEIARLVELANTKLHGQGLKHELIGRFRIVPVTPTLANELISGKGEIRSAFAEDKFKGLIDAMYASTTN
jgi:long-subunit acyl-CoA synthetase (AMP-forming)